MSQTKSSNPLPPFTALVASIGKEQERLAAYSHITTVKECVDAIPTTYREALRPSFFTLSNVCERYGRVNKTLQTMRTHKKNGTLPPQLKAIDTPEFQYTKDHLEKVGEGESNPVMAMEKLAQKFKLEALDLTITAKEAELSHLGSLVNHESNTKFMLDTIERIYKEQIAFHKGDAMDTSDNTSRVSIGRATDFANLSPNLSWMDNDYKRAKADVPSLAKRVIEIARSRDMAELQKSLARLEVHQKAQPSTDDAAVTVKTLNEYFDKRLAEEVRRLHAKGNRKPAAPQRKGNSKKRDPPKKNPKATGKVTKRKGKK